MKLIVQIPCFNEEQTLPETVRDIPRFIPGIDAIEILVIDDGSRDRTSAVARELGVEHVIRNKTNVGLARTFRVGLDRCIALGADIIVNTDADNQYCGADIAKLVQPILEGRVDVVVGDRQTSAIDHFSARKKMLQRFGSWTVRKFSGVDVPDAVSGFRAISRDAAMKLNIVSPFSYTIEMLIQVGKKGMAFTSVPIRTNPKTRDSRLFKSVFRFIERSSTTLLRMYSMYQPLRVFAALGLVVALIGAIPMLRFAYYYFFVSGTGKIQSLVIGSALLTIGALTFFLGLLADLLNHNRALIEMVLEKTRRLEAAYLNDGLGALAEQEAVPDELHQRRRAKRQDKRGQIVEVAKLEQRKEAQIFKAAKGGGAANIIGEVTGRGALAAEDEHADHKEVDQKRRRLADCDGDRLLNAEKLVKERRKANGDRGADTRRHAKAKELTGSAMEGR
jgi:glycosyltransferase involved in cell wall biosynthesis